MSTAAAAPVPEKPELVAPLWHTGLVVLFVLVPFSKWLHWGVVSRMVPRNGAAFDISLIVFYCFGVGLVTLGVSLQRIPLEDLIGKLWTGWRSALRDIGIGVGFWLLARFVSRLIYYLLPSHTPPRYFPHSIGGLLIPIFVAMAAGVAEELIFRGYLQTQFTALCGNAGAGLLIQAALFALYHGYTQTLTLFLQRFSFGLMAGLLAHWRKSLLPGMIGHAWYDAYRYVLAILHWN